MRCAGQDAQRASFHGQKVGVGPLSPPAGRQLAQGGSILAHLAPLLPDARSTAHQIGSIVLVNGRDLVELMIDHGVGVTTTEIYELKEIDQDYFEDA